MAIRIDVKSLDVGELEKLAVEMGQPPFRGRQLYEWLFRHGATRFVDMHTLPAAFRGRLAAATSLRKLSLVETADSNDGTRKVLFELSSGNRIESVLIPDYDRDKIVNRVTVCVSSQVGCPMGCTFCATGQMGFGHNLTASEIFDQVFHLNLQSNQTFGRDVTNVVYMGMGEPLLNLDAVVRSVRLLSDPKLLGISQRKITISTVGLARRIRQLADMDLSTNLAVSLHAPTDDKRNSIMPVNRSASTDLTALRESVTYYGTRTGRIVTYEYCMFAGFNDTSDDAEHLARICRWTPSKVNLIIYNPVVGGRFTRTSERRLDGFLRLLVDRGVRVTVRRSRGQDIAAACGQLATKSTADRQARTDEAR